MLNAAIEAMPVDALRALQLRRLQETVQRLQQHVPYYQQSFREHGVAADALTSLDDLERFPFTKKIRAAR